MPEYCAIPPHAPPRTHLVLRQQSPPCALRSHSTASCLLSPCSLSGGGLQRSRLLEQWPAQTRSCDAEVPTLGSSGVRLHPCSTSDSLSQAAQDAQPQSRC